MPAAVGHATAARTSHARGYYRNDISLPALTRTRFLPQWDLEGPTYSKMSARALRVQPGGAALRGRPSHVAAAAVQRRARPDCRHDCFACCSSQAGTNTPCMAALAWFLGPRVGPQLPPLCCPRRMPTGAVTVPHPGHIPRPVVARAWPCGTHGHAHAPREAPWRTAAAGHVTGPAPQGRPPWLHAQRACAHYAISRPL